MKKLSCFALVLAMLLVAGGAFASSLTNVTDAQVSTVGSPYDTFVISGEPYGLNGPKDNLYKDYKADGTTQETYGYLMYHAANLNRNKWLVDKKDGFTIFAVTSSDNKVILDAKSGTMATDATFTWTRANYDLLKNAWQNKVISTDYQSYFASAITDGFQGFLVRTAEDASESDYLVMPFNLVVSNDTTKFRAVLSGDMITDRTKNGLCEIDCCAVTFKLDCCTDNFVSADSTGTRKGYTQNLMFWFNDEDRYGVYCCQDFGIWVTSGDWDGATAGAAVFSPDFATAHLNDDSMVRVRVAPNDRTVWNTKMNLSTYKNGSVTEFFWPAEKDLTNTYSTRTAMQDCGLRYDWVQQYGASTAVKAVDLVDVADNYFTQKQFLGVWYGDANCDCNLKNCSADQVVDVPRVVIQNLGVSALDIKSSMGALRTGICSEDCGLCDTVLSADNSKVANVHSNKLYGYSAYKDVDGKPSTQTGYLAAEDISVDKAYRWGDFNYKHAESGSLNDNGDVIEDQCMCVIYPAFTKTIQPSANFDFLFQAVDGTSVTGRWNTAYTVAKLTSANSDPCCVGDFLYVWQPCSCGEQANIQEALTADGCTTTGLRYPLTPTTELKLETGIIVTITSYDIARIPAAVQDSEAMWYNYFKVKDVKFDTTSAKPALVGVQLRFTLDAADFTAAGFDPESRTWRADFWDKFDVVAVVGGEKITLSSVMSKLDFDWQGSLFAKVDEIVNATAGQSERKANTRIDVYLPIFMVNGKLCGDDLVKYVTVPATKNKMIVVNDGVLDSYIEAGFYIEKKGVVECTLTVSDPTLLVGETKTVTPVVAATCDCSDVVWGTVSSEVASAVVSGDSLVVTGLKVGTVKTSVALKCDETISKDVTITVTEEVTPTPTTAPSGSSSGGCNAGAFAPFALVLLAPLALLLKK